MTTNRYDWAPRRRSQFLSRTERLKPDWPLVPDAKVVIVPGRSSGRLVRRHHQGVEAIRRAAAALSAAATAQGNHQQPAVTLPSICPTLLITFFFGLFGLIPAIMHTPTGRRMAIPTPNYWHAFGRTPAVSYLFGLRILMAL